MKKALRMGISDVLPSSADTETLVESVYRSQVKKLQWQESIKSSKGRVPAGKVSRGKIISFFSTKGGVGTTFLAVNFAVLLRNETQKRVALVDLNLNYGNVALALNLPVRNSINDVVNEIRNIDGDLIESFMVTHESGLKVLASNPDPQLGDFVNGDHIQVILSTLQESFDYIVLDLPSDFLEVIRPVFALTNTLFMVTTPDILALSNVKSALILLREMNFPAARVRLALNRLSRSSMSKSRVERTLDMPVSFTIPEDASGVYASLNIGSPYVGTKKPFKKTGSIEQAVRSFIEEDQSVGSVV
ncbi:MAG: AAA family ATPase [Actinobacteria bacterium]|nr:AAA family ATPase [Actinomycetota bacterium]